MATKQAIVSQHDYGIALEIEIRDGYGNPYTSWDIDDFEVIVITPNGEKIPVDDVSRLGSDVVCNKVVAVLNDEHTEEVGNYSVYVRIQESMMKVTTVKAWNYYVLSEFGL